MINAFRKVILLAAGCSALSACSVLDWFDEKETPMAGERLSVLQLQSDLQPDDSLADTAPVLPEPWTNEFWPQAGGYPNHSMQNPALENDIQLAWHVSIGQGATKEFPLTAQPVVAEGKVFTLDTAFTLSAFNADNGAKLWSANVQHQDEDEPVISGGVAYASGMLYVTNGYNEILAVAPQDGTIKWRVRLPSPARAAATVIGERVFVPTLDNRLVALAADSGALIWDYTALDESSGLLGAASPAANRDIVVPVFSSGEIYALSTANGSVAWADNLSTVRPASGSMTAMADIRGRPVIDNGVVYAVNFGGRLVAIDESTGARLWQRQMSSVESPWLAGDNLFLLTTDNDLVALSRTNGAIFWVTALERYQDEEERDTPVFWTGPVLAGDRLFVAGTQGALVEVNPADGAILKRWSIDGKLTISPVVAGKTLYILSDSGDLYAYR